MHAEAHKSYVVNAMLDQSAISNIRFSISRIFWAGRDFYSDLPERVCGTFARWVNKEKLMPSINWDDGGKDTSVGLTELIPARGTGSGQ